MNKQNQNSSTLLRYCVGIDVSKDTLQVCVSVIDTSGKITIKGSGKISNKVTAFDSFLTWVSKYCKDKSLPVRYVMESTGVYGSGQPSRAISLVSFSERFSSLCGFTKQSQTLSKKHW